MRTRKMEKMNQIQGSIQSIAVYIDTDSRLLNRGIRVRLMGWIAKRESGGQ